ncbi:hypothetical protein ACE4V3_04460 (plasmid) [Borrelia recurrentis]|uniref:hypothetical protein n=1 Tax=Borrelia recurrentis TaxID=44449 RepID=UPI0002F26472|nr:hypothetical protein [Borrelia recurrentis]
MGGGAYDYKCNNLHFNNFISYVKFIYKCLSNTIKKYVYEYHTTKEYDEYLGNLYCDLQRMEIRRRLYDDGGFDV